MALTVQQRAEATERLVRAMFVEARATATLDTADLRALIDAMDDYLEANAAAINAAIPVGLRARATRNQKETALAIAALKRAGLI